MNWKLKITQVDYGECSAWSLANSSHWKTALETQYCLSKAHYRRMRSWSWLQQACFLGVIFGSYFLLVLAVTRPVTSNWFCCCLNVWLVVLTDGCDHTVVPLVPAKLSFMGAWAIHECCCVLKEVLTWKENDHRWKPDISWYTSV